MRKGKLYFILLFILVDTISILPRKKDLILKAIFLERVTRFIEWPDSVKLEDSSKPFILVVLGENPFNGLLENIYSKYKIKNKSVEIKYLSDVKNIFPCHCLFIALSGRQHVGNIITMLRNKPILTISQSQELAELGIHINLYIDNNRLRFIINESAARNAGLKMSYHLLTLAKVINPVEGERP